MGGESRLAAEEYRTFYETASWEGLSDKEKVRFASVAERIPADVDSILEVGCGDGRLSQTLPACRLAFTDISLNALQHFRRPHADRVQGSAATLPFADRSFDMVLCSEVLEHLPDGVFEAAVSEMSRLSRRYLLITVPYREVLRSEWCLCPNCGRSFHPYGHLRRFTESRLMALSSDFTPLSVWTFGSDAVWLDAMAMLRKPRIGGKCLHCNFVAETAEVSFPQRLLDWCNTNFVASWHKRPYWIVALYRRP
jgi:SAM-dependent methyltransferase